MQKAMLEHKNLILDVTGSNTTKLMKQAHALAGLGYDLRVIHVDRPLYQSATNVVNRYYQSGRFVDMKYLYEAVDHNPIETYKAMRDDPIFSHWTNFDNDNWKGKVTEQGSR